MYAIVKKLGNIYTEKVNILALTVYLIMVLIVCIYYSINNNWEKNFYCNNEIFEKLENDITNLVNNAGSIKNVDVNEFGVRRIKCLQTQNSESLLRLYYPKGNIYIDVAKEKNGIEVIVYKQIDNYIFLDFILIPMLITLFFMFLYYVFFFE